MQTQVAIIGAGPAGLTAGYLLAKENVAVTILEADPAEVGGIARTVKYKGYGFDIGGHRFFSKASEIEALWSELLPHDMLDRPRSSRIFYRQRFFSYPLKAFEALYQLGIKESSHCVLSYLKAKLFPIKPTRSFADWVTNHFGKRLFSIFFKTYTEKVWGMSCDDISADWAAQRIKGLSLFSAVMNALLPKKWGRKQSKEKTIKTLIDTFRYPRKGPGMLWEACADKIKQYGGTVKLNAQVYQCQYDAEAKNWKVNYRDQQGNPQQLIATHLVSSAPLRELVLDYLPNHFSFAAKTAASQLHYRDFLIVALIAKDKNVFQDNWVYVHDASVDVARIQNFKSWSPEMVPDNNNTCYGMEYFCSDQEILWSMSDTDLIEKAKKELVKLKLADHQDILDGCVVRQAKAYPVYDQHYQQHVATIKDEIETTLPTLYLVGRNGMHKYNNQDHAMMTAMLTVKNILANARIHDVFRVNQDAEYHEAGEAGAHQLETGLRQVPERLSS
jgi:protoporphyrinogen oxidase